MLRMSILLAAAWMLWGFIVEPCLAAEPSSPSDNSAEITVAEIQPVIDFLASDTLQGRDAGTEGGRASATFLSTELLALGLTPQAGDDFRQPFGQGYQNVIAQLPGSEPALASEWIVLGAHFDHVGFGNRTNSQGPFGQIHNGADDNASGVSCLLEIAEALKHGPPLRRTVVIAFWDAEEKGLWGSEQWLKTQPTPSPVKFYVNFDMVGRLKEDRLTFFGVRTALHLRSLLVEKNQNDLLLNFDWVQRDDSDHYNFYRRRIPYVMPFTGLHYDYHRPSDDVDKLNLEGIRRVGSLMTRCVTELANSESSLDFRAECPREQVASWPRDPLPSRLGIAWSPNLPMGEPLIITQLELGLPAEVAGLQVGDEIVQVNHSPVTGHAGFIALTRSAPKQSEFEIKRAADGAVFTVPLELRGWPLPAGATAAQDRADPDIPVLIQVAPQSEAADSGFRPWDRILGVTEPSPESPVRRWQVEREGRVEFVPSDSKPILRPIPDPMPAVSSDEQATTP